MPTLKPAVNILTRDGRPALNIKVYSLPHWPDAALVASRYKVSEAEAEQMRTACWNRAVEEFWRDADMALAESRLPSGAKVYSDGRSGGWLVVDGAGDVAAWRSEARRAWARFEQNIQAAIDYRASAAWANETLAELAEAAVAAGRAKRIRDAAPALLDALKLIACSEGFNGGTWAGELQAIARAAIAKVEG